MRLIDQVNAAIATCVMQGYNPAALVIGHDEWQRAQEDPVSAFGLAPVIGGEGTRNRIQGLPLLVARSVGGVIAIDETLRHALAQTGQFTNLV